MRFKYNSTFWDNMGVLNEPYPSVIICESIIFVRESHISFGLLILLVYKRV